MRLELDDPLYLIIFYGNFVTVLKMKERQPLRKSCPLAANIHLSVFFVLGLFMLSLGVTPTRAEQHTYQNHDSILKAAKNYIIEKVAGKYDNEPEISVNHLDSRLLLSECLQPLEVFSSPTERFIGRSTVGVRCTGSRPWTLYVQANIKAYTEVLVTTRTIRRGEHLNTSDFTLEKRDLSVLPKNYLSLPEEADGLVVKRPVQRGSVLISSILEAPKLVRRGQAINLLAVRNGIQVRSKGKALSDGTSGQRVRVKSLNSNRIIEGIVIDEGTVKVVL
jgi:flagella basal body P-ring formation protein FlgA